MIQIPVLVGMAFGGGLLDRPTVDGSNDCHHPCTRRASHPFRVLPTSHTSLLCIQSVQRADRLLTKLKTSLCWSIAFATPCCSPINHFLTVTLLTSFDLSYLYNIHRSIKKFLNRKGDIKEELNESKRYLVRMRRRSFSEHRYDSL